MKKYISAVAGSGKTRLLVNESMNNSSGRVLITTYTDENEAVIRSKFVELDGCIPENVIIQTWFSFLLQHGVRPYRNLAISEKVRGINFVEGQSRSIQGKNGQWSSRFKNKSESGFLDKDGNVYTDVISKLVILCDDKSQGAVFHRIAKIFSHIFIDESQDLAGYDLEVMKRLLANCSNMLIVGDPRQTTYKTHHSKKFLDYSTGDLTSFIETKCKGTGCVVDKTTLQSSHRCNPAACDLASNLFPKLEKMISANPTTTSYDGVFIVPPDICDIYMQMYSPTQLRYSVTTETNPTYPSINFGKSKGKTIDRVIIYPTKDITAWLIDHSKDLAPDTRAKFYVALTRARFSTCIIVDDKVMSKISGIPRFEL